MAKAVIFDLDGTLIHLPIDYGKLFQKFSKIMNTTNVRPLTEKISKLDNKTRNKIFEVWDEFELASSKDLTINEEGLSLYKKFHEIPKALVTMQGKALAQNVTNRLGLSFSFTVTREESLDRVVQLQIAVQKLKTQSKDVLFIGNTEEDYQATKKIGCQFLRVKNESMV